MMYRILLCVLMGLLCLKVDAVWASDISRRVFSFEGALDFKSRVLDLTLGRLPQGAVSFRMTNLVLGVYDVHVDVRHVLTPLGDAAAEIDGKFELTGDSRQARELSGALATHYVLLNYKPVDDLILKFALRRKELVIDPVLFGVFSGKALVAMSQDHVVEAGFDFVPVDMDDVWPLLQAGGLTAPPISGVVAGSFTLKGPLAKLGVSGRLSAYNGKLNDVLFERIDLRFEGNYPIMRLMDGNVVLSDGPRFKVAGVLDLSDLTHISTQFKYLKRDYVVSENDSGRAVTLSRVRDREGQTTQLKSFVSNPMDGRDEAAHAIGFQKQIGF